MDRPPHVTLIRPPVLTPRFTFMGASPPPLGVAYLAGTLAARGIPYAVIDALGEAIDQFHPAGWPDLHSHGLALEEVVRRIPAETRCVGLSLMFSCEFPLHRRLIAAIRAARPDVLIIAGGEHVTALPEQTLAACPELDACVLGEGEETLVALVESGLDRAAFPHLPGLAYRAGDGATARSPRRARMGDIDAIPPPDWRSIPLERYWRFGAGLGVNRGRRSMPIMATRGCPYQCTFCSNPLMWTTRWAARSPRAVVEEMKGYVAAWDVDNFDFFDLTAIVRKDWTVEFCELLLQSGLDITYQLPSGTRSEAIDREVARLLYRSGCRNLTYAPESGSPSVLKRIKKRIHVDPFLDSMRGCIEEGINVKANIIIGFPGETLDELRETFGFVLRMARIGVNDVSIQPFSPYPGTELFDQLVAEGRIGALDDRYYLDLANYADLSRARSWSEHLPDRGVLLARSVGLLSFYAASFGRRPRRFVRLLRNLARGEQESRLERALTDLVRRQRSVGDGRGMGSTVGAAIRNPPYI